MNRGPELPRGNDYQWQPIGPQGTPEMNMQNLERRIAYNVDRQFGRPLLYPNTVGSYAGQRFELNYQSMRQFYPEYPMLHSPDQFRNSYMRMPRYPTSPFLYQSYASRYAPESYVYAHRVQGGYPMHMQTWDARQPVMMDLGYAQVMAEPLVPRYGPWRPGQWSGPWRTSPRAPQYAMSPQARPSYATRFAPEARVPDARQPSAPRQQAQVPQRGTAPDTSRIERQLERTREAEQTLARLQRELQEMREKVRRLVAQQQEFLSQIEQERGKNGADIPALTRKFTDGQNAFTKKIGEAQADIDRLEKQINALQR